MILFFAYPLHGYKYICIHEYALCVYYTCRVVCDFFFSGILSGGGINATDQRHEVCTNRTLSQDPVESYFGEQRSRGHRNTNPNAPQFSTTANILRVSSGLSRKERGNVRGRERDTATTSTSTLRKRKQKRKPTV